MPHAIAVARLCRRAGPGAMLLAVLALGGCGSLLSETTADVSGVAGAGAANAVTKNAAVATGIGLGVRSIASAGLQYTERVVHRKEQDKIAAAAGQLPPGVVGAWSVVHTIPIENDEHGEVVVTRDLGDAGFRCKEIVFSVDEVRDQHPFRQFYTATVCLDGTVWKWASAEPATERWGALQ
jgi:hypothetical protein